MVSLKPGVTKTPKIQLGECEGDGRGTTGLLLREALEVVDTWLEGPERKPKRLDLRSVTSCSNVSFCNQPSQRL